MWWDIRGGRGGGHKNQVLIVLTVLIVLASLSTTVLALNSNRDSESANNVWKSHVTRMFSISDIWCKRHAIGVR